MALHLSTARYIAEVRMLKVPRSVSSPILPWSVQFSQTSQDIIATATLLTTNLMVAADNSETAELTNVEVRLQQVKAAESRAVHRMA